MLVVLAGFALTIGSGLAHSTGPVSVFLFLFGNAAVWTALFVLGLRWYGKPALWLLLVAPFAFFPVALLLLVIRFDRVPLLVLGIGFGQ